MEPYQVQYLPDIPAVLITVYETWDTRRHIVGAIDDVLQMMDTASEPVYYISDVLRATFEFDDIIHIAIRLAHINKLFQHPHLRETLVVATSQPVLAAVERMNSPAFGNVDIKTFETLDEALEYAHRHP